MAGNHMSTLSPRQRMINMMYLVLTALLALNVSKNVLNAFFRVDKTLTQSVSDKKEDNEKRYASFDSRAQNNPDKMLEWNVLAKELQSKTTFVDDLIDSIRYELWKAGGPTLESKPIIITDRMESEKSFMAATAGVNGGFQIQNKANENIPKIIMLGSEDGKTPTATHLKNVIIDYREYLTGLDLWPLNDTVSKSIIEELLSTKDEVLDLTTKSWEQSQYGGYPLVGVLTFLNQTRLNVSNAEDLMLELLEQKTGKSIVSIDKQIPYAIGSSYIMQGDDLEVDLFLAGIDTQTKPVYSIYELDNDNLNPMEGPGFDMPLPKGTQLEYQTRIDQDGGLDTIGLTFMPDPAYLLEDSLETNSDGMGTYIAEMRSKGTQYVGGFATVKSADGDLTYPWVMKVQVESPMPVIAATNLNVIYAGLDNDFTIAAPGNDPKDLKLVSNVGKKLKITAIKGEPGKYNLYISPQDFASTRKVKLTIRDKNNKPIGKPIEYRVFEPTKAVTTIDEEDEWSENCEISRTNLSRVNGLFAKKDPSFVYDLRYQVVKYSLKYQDETGVTQTIGPFDNMMFDPQVRNILSTAKTGQVLTFIDIQTKIIQAGKQKPGTQKATPITITVN